MKSELRKRAKELRKTLDIAEISSRLCILIKRNKLYKESKNVMLYYPTKYEIDLLSLLEDDKTFYFPRVNGELLQVCPYSKGCSFKKSLMGVNEPCSQPVEAEVLDLVIVPALMADSNGFRLGYGGGFYDRFLKNIGAKTLCALPKVLVTKKLPKEDFDIPIDIVISA